MTPPQRFVFDENLLRLGRALAQLRNDVTWFGATDIADVLPTEILDSAWIPVVGQRGWIIVTDDKHIRTRPHEAALAIEHGLKVIHLHGIGNRTAWDQAVRLLSRWPAIERMIGESGDGPWWLSIRVQQVRPLRFEPGAVDR